MCWLIQNYIYNPEDNKHYEGAFTQGNGYVNIRGSFEEDLDGATQNDIYWRLPANVTLEKARHSKSKWGVYVPGIYGVHPILGEEIVNLPYFLGVNLYFDSERLDMEVSDYRDFTRSLNMKNAVLERSFIWNVKGNDIEVNFKRYCSMENKNLVVQELVLNSLDKDVELRLENFIDAGITTNGYNHFTKVFLENDEALKAFVTTDTNQEVGIYSKVFVDGSDKSAIEFSSSESRIIESFNIHLKKNNRIIIKKYSIITTSIDADYKNDIRSLLNSKAKAINNDITMDSHEKLWQERWNISDINIVGDKEVQLAARFSIYHLLRAVNDSDKVAIDAKAYAGEAYFGHYFWDTEIYLLPFYIYTQPQHAKNLLMYRYNTLKGAKENAKRYGYEGARYPWEACISGREQCSNWQYSDLEIHVTADIVYGMWSYYEATGDEEFLLNEMLEIMVETARYWVSRVDVVDCKYRLLGVMGPDEYLPFTNDNSFTNYMVKFSLSKTVEVLEMAKKNNLDKFNELKVTNEEIDLIRKVSSELVFLLDDKSKFIHQCEGFEKFLEVDFEKVWIDKSKPFGNFISQEKNYRSKALKQADVVALLYLFKNDFDEDIKKNCIKYYEKLTTHDSSLSYIFHSLVYSDIKDSKSAYEFLNKSLGIDLYGKGSAEGIHIANCGAIWQGIVMGLCGLGLSSNNKELILNPNLPEHIKKIEFKVYLKHRLYKVTVEKHQVDIKEISK